MNPNLPAIQSVCQWFPEYVVTLHALYITPCNLYGEGLIIN